MVQPPVTRVPPIPAGVAAVCGLLGALPVAVFAFIAAAFSADSPAWSELLLGAVPAVVALVVLTGAVLLLAGRSWKVLVVGSVLTLVLVVVALADGAAEDDVSSILVLVAGPLLAALLGSSSPVRAWVAARRVARG